MVIKRGDIFYADLRPVVGSEQGGIRPVLIIQNDTGNRHSPTVICAAITSKMNKAKLPTHVEIDACHYDIVMTRINLNVRWQLSFIHLGCYSCTYNCRTMPVACIILNYKNRSYTSLFRTYHRS